MTPEGLTRLLIDGAFVFKPSRFEDERGWPSEIVSPPIMKILGTYFAVQQENQSFSRFAGV